MKFRVMRRAIAHPKSGRSRRPPGGGGGGGAASHWVRSDLKGRGGVSHSFLWKNSRLKRGLGEEGSLLLGSHGCPLKLGGKVRRYRGKRYTAGGGKRRTADTHCARGLINFVVLHGVVGLAGREKEQPC